ncbi:hypothetical protein K3495_g3881 [Podosphaera aphanis]|nr:hypothetical protein K3495_g3881 [Podosphaera aphanis]
MARPFTRPQKTLVSEISSKFPCREQQIETLATLVSIYAAPSRNIVLHGLEATGKTAITNAVLEQISTHDPRGIAGSNSKSSICYAVIKSAECIEARHLFEHTIDLTAKALGVKRIQGSIGNLSELVVELQRLLEQWIAGESRKRRFVLVFDNIDKQRDAPSTLVPALMRIGEFITGLTTIFITSCPRPPFLYLLGVPHIPFPPYSKAELLTIISLTEPDPPLSTLEETTQTWNYFTNAIYDSLSMHSGRDFVSFQALCLRVWPLFVRPILSGELCPTPFSRLMVANRSLFQNESILIHSMISTQIEPRIRQSQKHANIATLLSNNSRLLLAASYLASFNSIRNDATLFMKSTVARRQKKGGGTALTSSRPGASKSRKISSKLLGAQAFVLERMLAIFHVIHANSNFADSRDGKKTRRRTVVNGSADVLMGVATLIRLRLIIRMGSASTEDVLEAGTKYRVAIGLDEARTVARSVGVEIEDYLVN